MEVYFYCSYEHSQAGFFMTRMDGGQLVPASLDQLPAIAEAFFSFDRFQILWRDISQEHSSWLIPKSAGSFLGIRNLKGTIGGRSGTVNLAFWAEPRETDTLYKIGLAIFADCDAFRSLLFSWLSLGGPCSYQLNCAAVSDWIQSCAGMNRLRPIAGADSPAMKLLPYLRRTEPAKLEPDLLRLAVCTCSWKEIYHTMGHPWIWRRKPANVLTTDEYSAAFTGLGPLWELRTES